MMKIGIVGCAGRMGRMLVEQVYQSPQCTLIGGTEHHQSTLLNHDIGEFTSIGPIGIPITTDTQLLFTQAECIIDFTVPEATATHANLAHKTGCALVVGTTGLHKEQTSLLHHASQKVPIVWSANMSLGINLLLHIIEKVAQSLNEDEFDIEILEMHHHHKHDIPSGTAITLANAVASGRKYPKNKILPNGHTGLRQKGTIGLSTLRGGNIVGEHHVIFAGQAERLTFTHEAFNRNLFAQGAIKAALWTHSHPPGLYTMSDVLNLQ